MWHRLSSIAICNNFICCVCIIIHLRILHEDGYSQRECQQYIPVIFSNTVQSLAAILKAMGHLGIRFSDPEREVSQCN